MGGATHTHMMRQNLFDIESYAQKSLGELELGAGELPAWTHHILSMVHTHMHDVVHFLRHQASMGRRYGIPGTPFPQPGWAGQAGVATTSKQFTARRYGSFSESTRRNLREIVEYAQEAQNLLQQDAGIAPAWLEHKLSLGAGHLDSIGHWLKNESVEGRKYGQPRGGGGGGPRGPGRGPGHGGPGPRPGGRGGPRFPGPMGPGPGPGPGPIGPGPMGGRRGRFWRRHPHRHRHGGIGFIPWVVPYYVEPYYEAYTTQVIPYVIKVYAKEVDGKFVIGMIGNGFSAITQDHLTIRYRFNGEVLQSDAPMLKHLDNRMEIELPITKKTAPDFALVDISMVANSFFEAVPNPYYPFGLRKYSLSLTQKFDGQALPVRNDSLALGRRYAVSRVASAAPALMSPAQALEMQGPMGYLQRAWRSLAPGFGPVQEYGSMGYGSMGTGSMDQAVQTAMLQRTKGARSARPI